MISDKEVLVARQALEMALEAGAQKARVTYSRSEEDLVATLNGEVDRVTHCSDRALALALFVDGRYGGFSTNKLDRDSLKDFIEKAVDIVRTLAPDEFRDLPAPERCCKEALTGNELDLIDPVRESISPEDRIKMALDASIYEVSGDEDYNIISEEGEYSDSLYETVLLDSNGLEARHSECSFDYGVEITIESKGEKYSAYWWDSNSRLSRLDSKACGAKALERALAQRDAEPAQSGKYNMVVDSEVASRLVTPILRALNGSSIQQNTSFLMDSLGKQIFPEGMTIMDYPRIPGNSCSKLFDTEGVAAHEGPIIDKGVVSRYFLNTYSAARLGMSPTIDNAVRPKLLAYPRSGLNAGDIMELCGSGIYVTDFNGGNCNAVTGDFSFGVEGFLFENGKFVRAVSEMVVTGNLTGLWQDLIAAGEDSRDCMSKLIPTLAFANVDFSG